MKERFRDRVYEIVGNIPAGKVLTYGDVARYAGAPGAARAVGTLMKNNPDMKSIPCHRVVGSDGKMHGYAFGSGISEKVRRLKEEGITFVGDRIDLEISRWKI